ncbi:MAG: AAA family ATPase [Candidatus Hydrogenedentes bacterium]|nr:AAA family ATPase [Candidatus Hydrogenedentota bacterium]
MYEAFYGLAEKPFNLTPDPRFLYLSEKHKEAFAHLLFGIKNRSGFVMVSGEIGTGKTTICRTLLNQLDPDTEVAFIFNPCLSPEELLRKINEDFGIDSRAETLKGLIDELNAYLLDRNASGKNCVLVIDEAQNLTPAVLEQVRLLSNLETETQKLLQIVLIGQPELAQHLQLPELRQLNQRITARYHLKPLNFEETIQYIAYRLRVAGGRRKLHFTRPALKAVFRLSDGTPRVINAICDRALLIGYTRETREIAKPIIRQAAREIRGERVGQTKRSYVWKYVPTPTLLAAAILIVLAGNFLVMPWANRPVVHTVTAPNHEAWLSRTTMAPSGELAEAATKTEAARAVEVKETPAPDIVLDALDPVSARNAGALAILRAWNTAMVSGYPTDDTPESLAAFATANGLDYESLSPTFEQLLKINLPSFIKLATNRQQIWIALLGVEGENVRISPEIGKTVVVPRAELEPRYLSQAVILWRDPTPTAPVLQVAMTGDVVRDFQTRLRLLGLLSDDPSGTFDDLTVAAVTNVQKVTGLTTDGKVGKQTRMVMTSWLPEFAAPSLAVKALPVTLNSDNPNPAVETAMQVDVPMPPAATEAPAPNLEDVSPDASDGTAPPVEAPATAENTTASLIPEPSGDSQATTSSSSDPVPAPQEVATTQTGAVTVGELQPPQATEEKLAPRVSETDKEITEPANSGLAFVPSEPESGAEVEAPAR